MSKIFIKKLKTFDSEDIEIKAIICEGKYMNISESESFQFKLKTLDKEYIFILKKINKINNNLIYNILSSSIKFMKKDRNYYLIIIQQKDNISNIYLGRFEFIDNHLINIIEKIKNLIKFFQQKKFILQLKKNTKYYNDKKINLNSLKKK